jgi:acyl-[acyl carrier protein]--UDP-N-acetylglucosamine O-acyltransferase
VNKDVSFNQRLFVNNDCSFNNHLMVMQDVSFNQRLFVANDVSFNNKLMVMQDVSFNQHLFVNNDVSFNSKLFVNKDVSFNQRLFVANDVSLNNKLMVMQDVSLNQHLFVNNDVSFNSNLFVNNNVSINQQLSVGNTSQFNQDLTVGSSSVTSGSPSSNINLYGNIFVKPPSGNYTQSNAIYSQNYMSTTGNINIGPQHTTAFDCSFSNYAPSANAYYYNINIGSVGQTITDASYFSIILIGEEYDQVLFNGTVSFVNTSNLNVTSKIIQINYNSLTDPTDVLAGYSTSSAGAGINIQDGYEKLAGYIMVSPETTGYDIKAPESSAVFIDIGRTILSNVSAQNMLIIEYSNWAGSNTDSLYTVTVNSNIDTNYYNNGTFCVSNNTLLNGDVSMNGNLLVHKNVTTNGTSTLLGNVKIGNPTLIANPQNTNVMLDLSGNMQQLNNNFIYQF